jgi:uncharacterized membrane protein
LQGALVRLLELFDDVDPWQCGKQHEFMSRRIPLLFRHVMYNLRGGFLVRPLAIALALGGAGASLSWLEAVCPQVSAWVPRILFPEDPHLAQVILSGIAASIMTVVSIVFAILLMTLTLASMQFSPRIIVSFSRDRVTQWTLGIFLGTFTYCTAALPAARSEPHPFAPVMTVLGAMLLATVCVAWLLFFIHHVSHAISVNYIVDRIAAETEAVIEEMMPEPRRFLPGISYDPTGFTDCRVPLRSVASGYIRFVDVKRLVSLTKTHRLKAAVLRRVGHFVPEGTPLLMVSRADRLPRDGGVQFRAAFDLGPSRTLQQDVEFGVLQIVDIALKAISPAVNDPSTAINCVDQLSRILIRFVAREPPQSTYYDPPGIPRLDIRWTGFDHLLQSAFEQIRQYSVGDVAVSLRLLRALCDISSMTPDPVVHRALIEQGKRIVAGCCKRIGEEDHKELQARLASLREERS